MRNNARHLNGHRAAPWLRWIARIGIVAEGVIYLLIGGIAFAGALDPAEHPSGSAGAMFKLAGVPLGHAMLALLTVGLAAYVLWQLVLALFDPECSKGRWTCKRLGLRIHHLWSAVLHCVLVAAAAWQLLGFGHAGAHGQTQEHLTAIALRAPAGQWLVGGIGLGVFLFAILQLILACRPQKDSRMELNETPLRWPILILLVLGYLARGVLFGLIGTFLIHAAWTYDPKQAAGIYGALQSLRNQSYGPWLLGAVALGLIAYGLAQIAKARFREIRID